MPADDVDLMRALYDEHGAALWSYVLRLASGDRARAEDVVQETFLRAWRNANLMDDSRGSVRSWLFTVAKRIIIDEWRTRRVRSEVVTADVPEREVIDETDRIVQSWVVTEALGHLSAAHREALVECYYQGRSVSEVAARHGIPEGTVKSRLHYGLRALRLALEEMGLGAGGGGEVIDR
ncbi:MAG TPA: sigma-70 family RNA polymerase sigma factor [Mycobacteriales bacterium]|nr:sigma-70 family RNA polymerase sigma factor [Mycobacteriales bacterium]